MVGTAPISAAVMTARTPGIACAAVVSTPRILPAQDRGMQHALTSQIADKFAAASQKAQILDSLDRAADVTVGPDHGLSVFR
jgi:hypothetical protein